MREEFIALVLILLLLLFSFPVVVPKTNASSSTSTIDLYTQKKPFNGVGINQSSDAFAHGEEVILYAYVTYNLFPVENEMVAYEVHGPPNSIQNISFILTAETNASGISKVSFRIPWPTENPEIIVFGVWTVFGSVELADGMVVDKLTFNVGWIVEITRLGTVNQTRQPKTEFMKGTYVFAELTLRSIAMTSKNISLIISAIDAERYILGSAIMENLMIEPNETQIFCGFQIPEWAALGEAVLYANIYLSSNGLESPQVLTTFIITLLGDLNADGAVDIKDIAFAALAFGSYPEHPRWNSEADINNDGKVDIKDISIIARNFGKTDC